MNCGFRQSGQASTPFAEGDLTEGIAGKFVGNVPTWGWMGAVAVGSMVEIHRFAWPNPMTTAPEDVKAEIDRLEAQLDDAMRLFATFEEELNGHLRGASPEERTAIFARRAAYEQTLGIEALVERIFELRQLARA